MTPWLVAAAAAADLVVVDALGEPVAGVTLSAGDLVCTTDRRGRCALDVPPEGVEVDVRADGYAPVTRRLEPRRRGVIRVRLTRGDTALEVVVEAEEHAVHPTRHRVDAEQAEETPGALDDAVRLVQSLPSVAVQREYSPTAGDLSVRGSAPGDSRYFLDGIEIPYLYHFNQYASVFPTSQIGTLELLPSTFGPSFGDAVGAVVDARSRLEAPDAAHGSAHVNFVMFGGDVRAPVNDRVWVSASGRRSYQDLAGEASPQYPIWPVFHDAVVRVESGDATEGTGAFFMSAGDGYERAVDELDVVDPLEAASAPTVAYGEAFHIAGVNHRFVGRSVSGRWVGAAVAHRRDGALSGVGEEAYRSWTGVIRADLQGAPRPNVSWESGFELRSAASSLRVIPGGPEAARVAEEVPSLARGVSIDAEQVRNRLGAYGGVGLDVGPLRLMPGARVDVDDLGGGALLSPRATARLRLAERTAVKLAGGRYTQRPDDELLLADPALATTTSWQASTGLEQTLGGRVELGVDAYWKDLRDPVFAPLDGPVFVAPRGDAGGVESHLRYRLRERFFAAGWVGVQRARVQLDDGWTPADGDQRVSLGAVASWDVGRSTFGVRYRLASGLPFTQLEGSRYDAGNDAWVPRPGAPNGARLPTYQKLDLRVATTWAFTGGSVTASAEVWIVPRSAAQLYPTWNYDYTEQAWVVGPTLLPLLGLKARF